MESIEVTIITGSEATGFKVTTVYMSPEVLKNKVETTAVNKEDLKKAIIAAHAAAALIVDKL